MQENNITLTFPKPTKIRFTDITGQQFGRLTVLAYAGARNGRRYWLCRCKCGNGSQVHTKNLRNGNTKSCGCLNVEKITQRNYKHGKGRSSDKEYSTYHHIIARCNNPKNQAYSDYGGRGIKVCQRWTESFENFYSDMGDAPSPNHSIDRRNVNGDYSPDNCYWATDIEQANNKRNNRRITYRDKTYTLQQLANECNLNHKTLAYRIDVGWGIDDAVSVIPFLGNKIATNRKVK